MHKILLVDDDATLLQLLKEFLTSQGFAVDTASCGSEALARIELGNTQYAVVVVDFQMEGHNGAAVTRRIKNKLPHQKILVYSGDLSREAAIDPLRAGAHGFVDKAEGPHALAAEIRKLCPLGGEYIRSEQAIGSIGMVGRSTALATIADQVLKVARRTGPVLILGESGTGKELIARALHSSRRGLFLAVNCADYLMTPGTARSELFGHVKGAFTGATEDRKGVFELAAHGTLFLDEIHCLPRDAQWGLLRALQERSIRRLGSARSIPVECRIVAAGKPTLEKEIDQGPHMTAGQPTFTPDLYYRISQNKVHIPPLRERIEDLPPLVHAFTRAWNEETSEQKVFLNSAIDALTRYSWPGNVRELENTVYNMLNTVDGPTVDAGQLPAHLHQPSPMPLPVAPLRAHMEGTERAYIIEAASRSATLKQAAQNLGLTPQNLLRLFKKHRLESRQVVGAALKRGQKT